MRSRRILPLLRVDSSTTLDDGKARRRRLLRHQLRLRIPSRGVREAENYHVAAKWRRLKSVACDCAID